MANLIKVTIPDFIRWNEVIASITPNTTQLPGNGELTNEYYFDLKLNYTPEITINCYYDDNPLVAIPIHLSFDEIIDISRSIPDKITISTVDDSWKYQDGSDASYVSNIQTSLSNNRVDIISINARNPESEPLDKDNEADPGVPYSYLQLIEGKGILNLNAELIFKNDELFPPQLNALNVRVDVENLYYYLDTVTDPSNPTWKSAGATIPGPNTYNFSDVTISLGPLEYTPDPPDVPAIGGDVPENEPVTPDFPEDAAKEAGDVGVPHNDIEVVIDGIESPIKLPTWLVRQAIALQSKWYTSVNPYGIIDLYNDLYLEATELVNELIKLKDVLDNPNYSELISKLNEATSTNSFDAILSLLGDITDLPIALIAWTERHEYKTCFNQNVKDTERLKTKSKATDFIQLPRFITREEIRYTKDGGTSETPGSAYIYRYRTNKLWRDPRKFQLDQFRQTLLTALGNILDSLSTYGELTTIKINDAIGNIISNIPATNPVYTFFRDAQNRAKNNLPSSGNRHTTDMVDDLTYENYKLIFEGNEWDFLYTREYATQYMELIDKWERFKQAVCNETDLESWNDDIYWYQIPEISASTMSPGQYTDSKFWKDSSDDEGHKLKYIHWDNYNSVRVKSLDRKLVIAYDKMMGMTPFTLKYSAIFENIYMQSQLSLNSTNRFVQFMIHCNQVIKKMPTQIQNIITGILEPMGAAVMSPVGPATVVTNILQILGQVKRTTSEINALIEDIISLTNEAENLGLPAEWYKPLETLRYVFKKVQSKLPFS